jgi:P27 family predicted phage terminase small subunit
MGLRGPPPKPTSIRIAEGNPSRRPISDAEPHPDGEARMPAWLSAEAKRVWSKLAPICQRMGVLTDADEPMFAAFCDAYATFRACHEIIAKEGRIQKKYNAKTHDCYEDARPEVKMLVDAQKLMLQIGARFGLNPSDRSRIAVGKKEDEDPFAALGAV